MVNLFYLATTNQVKPIIMTIGENNKLIANFIKLKTGIYPSGDGKGYWVTPIGDVSKGNAELLAYNTSWDWLMPVVERIEELGYEMTLDKSGGKYLVHLQHKETRETFVGMSSVNRSEATYEVVIAFIKYYNENKPG